MDPTEIALASEQLKKTPHFLDKLPVKKNTTKGRSADSQLERILPSKEKEAKTADELTRVFNTTTRAGAGGTKLGLPGIRPSGGKAASLFLENYTGTGRYTPPPAPFTSRYQIKESRNEHVKKPSVVLYKLCMDCMKPVPKDDAIPNMTIIPEPNKCLPQVTQKWQSVNLKAGDILCYLFCLSCVKEAQAISQDPVKQMPLIQNGQETTLAKYELAKRAERISDQVFQAIKAERFNPDSDCFYNEAKYA